MAGRYKGVLVPCCRGGNVSILARLNGRALPGLALRLARLQNEFQSSPGLMAGRYIVDEAHSALESGFNPRPA